MKRLSKYLVAVFAVCGLLSSCSDYEPRGYDEVPPMATASALEASVTGRTVTLTWQLPASGEITGVRVSRDNEAPTLLPADATTCTLKGQPMDRQLVYTVKVEYKGGFVSEGISVIASVPFVASKMAYLMTAADIASLPDDDERAAATWFAAQENSMFIQASEISSLDPDIVSVIWIEIDREGLPLGWKNLPAEVSSDATIAALREYSANGGSIYLANMATQLTLPLGFVPDGMEPTLFGSGAGGTGTDVWVINPYLGWDFRDGADQGFYDRTTHAIFKGLTLEDPNGYGYDNLPLIGPGHREDHNCMWDCNIYGKGSERDVIANFEKTTNSMVLATWGHVRDHCVAGLVDFYAAGDHGRCVANGFAAYEWNQNSGANPYQHNVEQLTLNILQYLQ